MCRITDVTNVGVSTTLHESIRTAKHTQLGRFAVLQIAILPQMQVK
jgi:hypothetical protein